MLISTGELVLLIQPCIGNRFEFISQDITTGGDPTPLWTLDRCAAHESQSKGPYVFLTARHGGPDYALHTEKVTGIACDSQKVEVSTDEAAFRFYREAEEEIAKS